MGSNNTVESQCIAASYLSSTLSGTMIRQLVLLITCISVSMLNVSAQEFSRDPGNANLDFSAGDFSNWDISWGPRNNPYDVPGAQPGASSHTIIPVYGTNWDGMAGPGALPRVPQGLSRVARLGAPAGGGYANPKSYAMRYTIQVHAAYPILFLQLAAVMDATHTGADNTHYRFTVRNSAGDRLATGPCSGIELYPGSNIPNANTTAIPAIGIYNLPAVGNTLYQPWESIAIDLSPYIGQSVVLELEHFDCISGYHGSYDYVSAGLLPVADTIYFCKDQPGLTLRPYIPGFKTYQWSNGSTADTLHVNTPADGAMYSCSVSSYNGCSAGFTYWLREIRIATGFEWQPGTICNQVLFTDTSSANYGQMVSREWHFGDSASGMANTDTGQQVSHTYSQPGQYIVTLTVTTSEGCSRVLSKAIEIAPDSMHAAFSLPGQACAGDIIECVDLSEWTYGRTWYLDRLPLSDTAAILHRTLASPGVYTFSLKVLSSNGCSDSLAQMITIRPLPEAVIRTDPYTRAAPVSLPRFSFRGSNEGVVAYFWDFGWNNAFSLESAPVFSYPSQIDSYRVRLKVTSGDGCSDTVSTQVHIMPPDLFLPNAFSPNGDGLNDVFRPVNITNQRILECSIFNRWGERVFYASGNTWYWDGTYRGQPADNGTYKYLLRYLEPATSQRKEVRGDLILIR